jgi:hypothetical protein
MDMTLQKELKAFRLDEPQYNMNTYFGRMRHFFNVFNPM